MKEKVFFALIISILTFQVISYATESENSLKIGIEKDISNSSEIKFNIYISNLKNIEKKPNGIKLDLFYDKDILECINAKKGNAAGASFDANQDYPEEGRIRLGIASLFELNNDGTIYTVTFKAKDDIDAKKSYVRLVSKEVVDSSENEIPTEVENGEIEFEIIQLSVNEKKANVTILIVLITIILLIIFLIIRNKNKGDNVNEEK